MAEIYGPFDSGVGANFRESEWSEMFRHMVSDGIVPGYLNSLQVHADNTGMQVKVKSGAVYTRGHWYRSDAERTLAITAAHATLARWDLVILKLDWTNNLITVEVKTGTAAASPADPALTQNTSLWETALARVIVPAADGIISADQVTDLRVFSKTETINQLINPGFEIWQRGTGPFTANNAYAADRWQLTVATSTVSVSRETANVKDSLYSAAITYTHSGGGSVTLRQILEDIARYKGRVVTYSKWIKSSVVGTVKLRINDGTNNYDSPYNTSIGWELLTITAFIPTSATVLTAMLRFDVASCVCYADNGVLVISPTPADFTPFDPPIDLMRCQRYYQISNFSNAFIVQQHAGAGVALYFWTPFAVEMGGVPTMTKVGTFTVTNCGQPSVYSGDKRGFGWTFTVTAAGVGQVQGTGSAYFSAEWNP